MKFWPLLHKNHNLEELAIRREKNISGGKDMKELGAGEGPKE